MFVSLSLLIPLLNKTTPIVFLRNIKNAICIGIHITVRFLEPNLLRHSLSKWLITENEKSHDNKLALNFNKWQQEDYQQPDTCSLDVARYFWQMLSLFRYTHWLFCFHKPSSCFSINWHWNSCVSSLPSILNARAAPPTAISVFIEKAEIRHFCL